MSKRIWLLKIVGLVLTISVISLLLKSEVVVADSDTAYYAKKLPVVGQPLSPELESFLLNNKWCYHGHFSMPVNKEVVTFSKIKGTLYKHKKENIQVGDSYRHKDGEVTVTTIEELQIRMTNDKELVFIEASKYDKPITVFQTRFMILNNNKFISIGVGTATQENDGWNIRPFTKSSEYQKSYTLCN